jgi:protein TonB
MIARLTIASALAAFVTLTLLYAMQMLVASGHAAITDPENVELSDVVRVEREEPEKIRALKPERPPQPAMRPAALQPNLVAESRIALAANVIAPHFIGGAQPSDGLWIGDSELHPIVKVAPAYPQVAVARDLEGYVLLEFTVTTAGTVRDINVLESTAPLLEASAIKAALRFEYKPRIVGGEPVEVTGVLNKIVFELTEPQRMAMQL